MLNLKIIYSNAKGTLVTIYYSIMQGYVSSYLERFSPSENYPNLWPRVAEGLGVTIKYYQALQNVF